MKMMIMKVCFMLPFLLITIDLSISDNTISDDVDKINSFFVQLHAAESGKNGYDLIKIKSLTTDLGNLLTNFGTAYSTLIKNDDQKSKILIKNLSQKMAVPLDQPVYPDDKTDLSVTTNNIDRMGKWKVYEYLRATVNNLTATIADMDKFRAKCKISSEGAVTMKSVIDWIHDQSTTKSLLRLPYKSQADSKRDQTFWFKVITTDFMRASVLYEMCAAVDSKNGDISKIAETSGKKWKEIVMVMEQQVEKLENLG